VTGAPEVEVAVVGAGAAGLAAALELRGRGADVALLDAGEAPGGVMRSEAAEGFLFERGPNALQVKPAALAFLRRHRLEAELIPAGPEARLRHLLRGGRLVPVPAGLGAAVATPLLSARGKLRALAELFVPRGDAAAESVAEFIARRLGHEALDALVAPFLVGVYAGDETRLGAEAVFPALVAFEREHGSILRGALAGAVERARLAGPQGAPLRGLRGSWSAPAGLGGLARILAERLGEQVALRTRVASLAREGAGFRLELEGGARGPLRARGLVLALPAPAAAELTRALDPELAALLARIEYAPLVSAALSVEPGAVREAIRGFGFLVPAAAGQRLLGALFMSRVFPGRAPAGSELLTCMIGGVRWPEAVDAPEDVLVARLAEGLDVALGLREAPRLLALTRWPRAVPQPGRDHLRLVAQLRAAAAAAGPLRLAGGYLDGVAVSDAIASGVRAAEELGARGSSSR
jgi:oxygen-dependent protoporphyrinogen oxidase